jgi:glycine cleavage system transcriptional repressor
VNGRTVLTAIGEDRPGLVEEVSEFVFARGGSIEDSRMANMHGQFAIAMLISGSQESIDRITSDLDALNRETAIHARLTPALQLGVGALQLPGDGKALDQPARAPGRERLRGFGVNIEAWTRRSSRRR